MITAGELSENRAEDEAENRAGGRHSAIKSFRDPAGAVYRHGNRIVRIVRPESAAELDQFLTTRTAREAMDAGKLVRSTRISPEEFPFPYDALPAKPGIALYEHERVWFPSYPHEWPAELLYAAARVTAELFQSALSEGFGLKDATPYNVLFRGASPLFVDVLSFERRDPRRRHLARLCAVRAHVPAATSRAARVWRPGRGDISAPPRRLGARRIIPMGRAAQTLVALVFRSGHCAALDGETDGAGRDARDVSFFTIGLGGKSPLYSGPSRGRLPPQTGPPATARDRFGMDRLPGS